MKGKDTFTLVEINKLQELIILRNQTPSSGQKAIRDKMRRIGFYGKDDWGIINLQISDLQSLIKSGRIKVADDNKLTIKQEIIASIASKPTVKKNAAFNKNKDENYVLDICDKILNIKALRQHRFDFLLGDINSKGVAVKLPLDGYYQKLKLVVEYRERQHTEKVRFFDKPDRITVSGVHRGEQRKIYDERRRQVLPNYNIDLIEFSYSDFNYDRQKRIIRNQKYDEAVVKKKLEKFSII